MNRLQEIETRLAEIRTTLEKNEGDVDALEKEIRTLTTEKEGITKDQQAAEKRRKLAEGIQTGTVEVRTIDQPGTQTPVQEARAVAEKRGKEMKEGRSVTVASTGVILPNYQANDIKPTFNQVSSLVDMVNHKILQGGETFKQPYSTGYGEGGYTTEGGNPTDAEATFDSATIAKTKIAAYAEDSDELIKLPGADYDGEVQKGIRIACRKKTNREIMNGDGAAGHFVGIFSALATAIDAATDKEIIEIDETTLDEIIFSFGGDEDVEDIAVLILNKSDLKEFAMLRGADGEKVYDIKPNGNTGTIDTIPYIINSKCKPLSASTTAKGEYCMAYGPLSNYTMAIFSDIDITRSTDYKFKEGMICNKGVVYAGGNVTAKNGFLRVKKG